MVGLSPTWIALTCRKILETVNHIQGETEEYVIIHINLLLFLLIWIQWRKISLDDCNSSLLCCQQEIAIDFLNGSISLSSLGHVVLREIFDYLILLVPVSNSFWVEAIKWAYYFTQLILVRNFSLLFAFEIGPIVDWQIWFGQEILLCVQNLIDILLHVFPETLRYLVQTPNQGITE